MKILFLSQRFLLPMDTGGKIRTGKILEQLSKLHEITLISNFEKKKDSQYLDKVQTLCKKFIPVPWAEINKHSILFFVRLFFQMFSRYPVSALNDYSSSLRKTLEREYDDHRYDLIICDFVQSAMLFRNIKDVPTLLFQHNVESVIARRHIDRARNVVAKLFWWMQWKKMFLYEKQSCLSFDTVIAVSEADKQQFDLLYGTNNTVTIPTGVDIEYYAPPSEKNEKEANLVFCGSMDWLPNEDAVNFFIDEILPLLKVKIRDINLTVVGRNPSPGMIKKGTSHPEVTLTGWVDDTRPHLNECELFIVPIRIGGGTRMKIFEAMAAGKTIVSTTIGAEGLPVEHGANILLVDEPEQFANVIIELLHDEEKREKISKNAFEYVRENFSWKVVANQFEIVCAETVRPNNGEMTGG